MVSTIQNLCKNSFIKNSNRVAIKLNESDETITYKEVEELIGIIEQRLQNSKIHPGDYICSIAPLNIESVLLGWACIRQGIIFVPIDHFWSAELINHVINEVDAKLVFCISLFASDINREIIIYDEQTGSKTFSDWLDERKDEKLNDVPTLVESDEAIILYTSGSTGNPKGVVLSQGALFRSGRLVTELFEWNQNDVFMNLGDLHVMSGFRNTCIAPLHVGCSVVIAEERFRSTALLLPEVIKHNKCSFIGVAPIIVRQLNMSADRFELSSFNSVRAVLCTGGFLDPKQVRLFHDNFSIPVLNYYGLTETTGLCAGFSLMSFNPDENSIGLEIGAKLEIVDENDDPVSNSNTGFLRVKSRNLMKGYYKQPDLTKQVIRNGWFYTGDIAEKRSDDFFILKGRSRNIIKNIYTDLIHLEEVELALERNPKISEAGISYYISDYGDERMAAFIVLNDSLSNVDHASIENEFKQFLITSIGKRKVPHKFYFVEKLARSTNGKLLRNKLKELINDQKLS